MNLSTLWKKGLFYMTVPLCVCCGEALHIDERALCANCRSSYETMKDRDCAMCFKPIHRCTCPCDTLDRHYVHKLIKVTRYIKRDNELPANHLVYSLKKDNRADVEDFMSDELMESLRTFDNSISQAIFTHVPRRRAAIAHFGYDHAERLARAVARKAQAEHRRLFVSCAKQSQKQLHGVDRLANAQVRLRRSCQSLDLKGRRVYLVDDIVTTGASMSSTAMMLHAMGAKEIIGICFSIAYLDT